MDNSFTLVKRGFSAAIAAATIMWAVGLAAFTVPQTAHAASGGDVVRGVSLSTVYYVGYDGVRYTFTGEKVYDTWFNGFSMVETISDSELAAIPLGGNVVYRPGSRWIKIQSVADTYAVSTNGMIHHIESEAIATDFAGSDWNQNIDDVPDVFFVDYTSGTSLMSATAFDGAMFMDGGNYYLSWGGEMRMVSAAGRSANYMEDRFFLDGAGIDSSALDAGDDVTGLECTLVDAAQTGCDDTEVAGGDVAISLNSGTPAGATLPPGANSVKVLTFNLKAGSEDARVNTIALTLAGIGATTNISNVYLYEGNTRLTEARSVNASTRKATFGSLKLDIPAGTTRTLTARIEVASGAAAGDVIQFQVKENADIITDGGAVSGAPVTGNSFPIAATAGGSITITKNGTIVNPDLGGVDEIIGQFKVAASSSTAELSEITLKIDNSADHDNFWLWDGNVALAEGTYIGDKLVSFDLSSDPFIITDGNSNVFQVSADIGGEAADTIGVYVDNSVDVLAIDQETGFGMTVNIASADGGSYDGATNCDSTSDNCSFSTIQGGKITFSTSPEGSDDIQVNAQDQTLLAFTLTSAQAVTIKDLDIIVYGDDDGDNDAFDATEAGNDDDDDGLINGDNDGAADSDDDASLKDIKIVNVETGLTVMGPLELDSAIVGGDDADQTIDFTDDFEMVAGETLHLEVRADIDDGVTSGTTFGATIDISGFSAEDDNGDALTNATDVVPSTDAVGNNHAARSAALTVSLASTPGDVTAVQNASGKLVQSFSVQAGTAGSVNITSITLSNYAHDAATGTFQLGDCTSADQCATRDVDVNDFIASCSLYDNEGNLLDGPVSPESDGTNTVFNDVNWTIEANESELIDVKCNLANPSETNNVFFAFDIADLSEDITAEDDEGVDVDPTTDAPNGGTSPTDVLTVAAVGTLALAVDSSTPAADILLTNTNDNLLGVFRFTATNEDFKIKKLTITEEAAEDKTGTTNGTTYTNNISRVTLSYTDSTGATKTPWATMSGNEALFTGLDINAKIGTPAKVSAKVNVPQTDRSGGNATSNEYLELGVSVDTSADDQFEASGVDSGTKLDDDDVSAVETNRTFVVKETRPTISVNGSSPSGTGFVPGDIEVFRFDVKANANEDVIIDEMLFAMASTDNTGSPTLWNQCKNDGTKMTAADFDMYNLSTDGLSTTVESSSDVTLFAADGDTCDTTADTNNGEDVAYWRIDLTSVETVPAGSTYTFAVYIDSTGASAANDDSISLSIPADPFLGSASFLTASDINNGNLAVTDTVITVTSGTNYSQGDIICLDTGNDACGDADEKALVVSKSTNDLTIVRGYLNTTPVTLTDADEVDRLQSTFYWEDDGDSGTDNTGDNWGSYLLKTLPAQGGNLQF